MHYRHTIVDMRVDRVPGIEEATLGMERLLSDFTILARSKAEYPFPPDAYTVTWVLAESHAVLHTTPQEFWIEIVLATCSNVFDHDEFVKKAVDWFRPTKYRVHNVEGAAP